MVCRRLKFAASIGTPHQMMREQASMRMFRAIMALSEVYFPVLDSFAAFCHYNR
jgi:hypothetical protein